MKIVVIQLPSILSDAEIKEALQIMALHLPVPETAANQVAVNIINSMESLSPSNDIANKCDSILKLCCDPNSNISTITNFWSNINSSKITKGQLLEIMRHPTVARIHLKKRNAECFFNLFETALKHL